jgi:hypothetical protein
MYLRQGGIQDLKPTNSSFPVLPDFTSNEHDEKLNDREVKPIKEKGACGPNGPLQ